MSKAISLNVVYRNLFKLSLSIEGKTLLDTSRFIMHTIFLGALYSLTQAIRIEMRMNSLTIPVFGVYPGPIDTEMSQNVVAKKESPANLAIRVFDGMEQGVLDITTDELSDHFKPLLKKDTEIITELKKAFST